MSRGGRRSAAVLAAALLAAAAAAALLAQGAARDAAGDRQQAEASARVERLQAGVEALLARASALAAVGEDPLDFRRAATAVGLPGAALVDAAGVVVASAPDAGKGVPARGTDLRGIDGLARGLELAAATATPAAAGPLDAGSGPAIAAVAPVLARGAGLDLASRRAAHRGTVVVLGPLPTLWSGGPVRITTPTGTFGPVVDEPVLRTTVRVAGDVWELEVGAAGASRLLVGWLVLGIGVAAAALAAAVTARQQSVRRRAEEDVTTRSRQLEMIAETSASLQQSLELGHLLPVFCVEVATQFDLSCVVVHLGDGGRLVEAFRLGTPAPAAATTSIALRRGWRTVGRIEVCRSAPLDEVTRQSLQALGDLLAVAVGNAELLQREQQAVSRLRELDTLKSAFLGTVSHELRTSATAVQGFGDLLAERWDLLPDDRRRELAFRMRRQAGSLRHLVDDLLDYARLEGQGLRVSPRDVSLTEVCSHLIDSMAPLLSEHQVVLRSEQDVRGWVDPIAAERILANLLSNAGKYAPPGTRVTVALEQAGDRAVLTVADEGPGIPVEERRRVFVRFYRLDNPQTVRTTGAGIGLSILHDFALRSGAEVAIEDAPGGGALVRVAFPAPRAAEDLPPDPVVAEPA